MKAKFFAVFRAAFLMAGLLVPLAASAQWPPPPMATPNDQRNALNHMRTQLNLFQNATRTASNFGAQGAGNLDGQFQETRNVYHGFLQTLTPQQRDRGANSLAELDSGFDILGEAFTYYQNDLAAGRPANAALRDLCKLLSQGMRMWSQEFNKTCSALRVGLG
jgi:hypothetical protein